MKQNEEIKGVGWVLFDPTSKGVCIHRRDSSASSASDTWDHFGGGFEADKDRTALDALSREVREELGIEINVGEVKELTKNAGQFIYYIPFKFEKICQIKLGEGAGLAWLTLDGALSLSDLTQAARDILNLLKSHEKGNSE